MEPEPNICTQIEHYHLNLLDTLPIRTHTLYTLLRPGLHWKAANTAALISVSLSFIGYIFADVLKKIGLNKMMLKTF